jgi:thymidylate synthase (FAD)
VKADKLSAISRRRTDDVQKFTEAGVAKECARMILPMASTTTIHISGTLRDLLGFINVRCIP